MRLLMNQQLYVARTRIPCDATKINHSSTEGKDDHVALKTESYITITSYYNDQASICGDIDTICLPVIKADQ